MTYVRLRAMDGRVGGDRVPLSPAHLITRN